MTGIAVSSLYGPIDIGTERQFVVKVYKVYYKTKPDHELTFFFKNTISDRFLQGNSEL